MTEHKPKKRQTGVKDFDEKDNIFSSRAYGEKNWDFPTPDCPYAPFPYYNIYHE